jgi:hypothetical protein
MRLRLDACSPLNHPVQLAQVDHQTRTTFRQDRAQPAAQERAISSVLMTDRTE